MDKVSKEDRSRIMRRIRGKDTGPELAVRRFLHARGFRYRLHDKRLPGAPDLVFPGLKVIVFVHGCFWHQHPGCIHSGIPLSNREYWGPKLNRTVERDRRHRIELTRLGWRVIALWECEIEPNRLEALAQELKAAP